MVQRRAVQPTGPPRAGNVTVAPLPANVVNFSSANDSGQPLPPPVRQKMEAAFGASFADVRVHVTPQANLIGALAFTQGNNLYFAPGQYNPQTPQGRRLLAYELTHVVQQRAGRVRSPRGSGTVIVQNASLEAEAERMAQRMAFVNAPSIQSKPAGTVHTPPQQTLKAIQPFHQNKNTPGSAPSWRVVQLASTQKVRYCKSHGQVRTGADNLCPSCSLRTNANPPVPELKRGPMPAGGGGAAPAGAVPAVPAVPAQAATPDVLLTSTIYLWESGAWTSRNTNTASVGSTHAEVYLYNWITGGRKSRKKKQGASGETAPEKESWIGFKQNAWPCTSRGCVTFFTQRSNKYSFVFNVTGDHGQYAKEHDKTAGATGVVYFYDQQVYYAKADLPGDSNAPNAP